VVATFNDGAQLHLTYPGLKAGHTRKIPRYQYDFRVDFSYPEGPTRTISHAEIVLDLYSKVTLKHMTYEEARNLLRDIRDGRTPPDTHYAKQRIPAAYVATCRQIHEQMGKSFRPTSQQALSPFQLAALLIFILLQEEANYPSYILGKRSPFSGRTLALDRYIEAIWSAAHAPHRLSEVLLRTLQERGRPKRWEGVSYDL
jgi:hypothetical protein